MVTVTVAEARSQLTKEQQAVAQNRKDIEAARLEPLTRAQLQRRGKANIISRKLQRKQLEGARASALSIIKRTEARLQSRESVVNQAERQLRERNRTLEEFEKARRVFSGAPVMALDSAESRKWFRLFQTSKSRARSELKERIIELGGKPKDVLNSGGMFGVETYIPIGPQQLGKEVDIGGLKDLNVRISNLKQETIVSDLPPRTLDSTTSNVGTDPFVRYSPIGLGSSAFDFIKSKTQQTRNFVRRRVEDAKSIKLQDEDKNILGFAPIALAKKVFTSDFVTGANLKREAEKRGGTIKLNVLPLDVVPQIAVGALAVGKIIQGEGEFIKSKLTGGLQSITGVIRNKETEFVPYIPNKRGNLVEDIFGGDEPGTDTGGTDTGGTGDTPTPPPVRTGGGGGTPTPTTTTLTVLEDTTTTITPTTITAPTSTLTASTILRPQFGTQSSLETPKLFRPTPTSRALTQLRRSGKGVNVVVGQKIGKQRTIAKNVHPFTGMRIGRKYVDKNIEASFKLKPSGRKATGTKTKPFNVGPKFRPSKKNPLFLVEKKRFRLDTPTERRQLSILSKKAKKRKR